MTKEIRFNDLSLPIQFMLLWGVIVSLILFVIFGMFNTEDYKRDMELNNSVVHKICWNETQYIEVCGRWTNTKIAIPCPQYTDKVFTTAFCYIESNDTSPLECVNMSQGQKQVCKAEDLG